MISAAGKEPETWYDSVEGLMLRFDQQQNRQADCADSGGHEDHIYEGSGQDITKHQRENTVGGAGSHEASKVGSSGLHPDAKERARRELKVADKDKQKGTCSIGLFLRASPVFTDMK